ncbi:MAG: GxxExxY protein [Verrucomicrobiales bacterium]|nr:GxxExxY protein [Verrucomicrobiales bacterium]
MKDDALTGRIIAAAINVHKALGPGFLESVYEEALAIEFDLVGLRFERQKIVPISYRGRPVGEHRLDFLVENRVVVELKAGAAL